ncbi:MAG: plethodontid receptivity factor PRF, partial [Bacteroides sp.]
NPIKAFVNPKVTSNCAGQISVRPSEGSFVVAYDAEDCLPEEENFLNIDVRIEGKRVTHKAFLKDAGGSDLSFSVVPEGKLILTADSVAGRKIVNINIRLTLNN